MTSPPALLLAFAAFAAVLTGCGDDGGGGSVDAYCNIADELNTQDSDPSDDQLAQVAAAAPSEIKDEVNTIVDALQAGDDADFENDDLIEAGEAVTSFTEENCGDSSSSE